MGINTSRQYVQLILMLSIV